jgi:rhomboid protease GluP
LDLDTVLVWTVGLSTVSGLAGTLRLWRRRLAPVGGWVLVFSLQGALLALGLLAWPDDAGSVAAWPWLFFVLVPALARRQQLQLAHRRKFTSARRLARVAAFLHPFDGWRDELVLLAGLAALQRDDLEEARRIAARARAPRQRLSLELQVLRVEGDWAAVRQALESSPAGAELEGRMLYGRALGETGDPAGMLLAHAALGALPLAPTTLLGLQLATASLCGDRELVERLLATAPELPAGLDDFWRATALQAAGRPEEAEPILERLLHGDDRLLVRNARLRREHPVAPVQLEALPPAARRVLEELRRDAAARRPGSRGPLRPPFATLALIAINLAAFSVELWSGIDEDSLIRLGAMILPLGTAGAEPWRMLTAGFLHAGWLHLGMNLLALWVLGRSLERAWGWRPVTLAYFAATFGGNALGALAMTVGGRAGLALGASGGVMGLLGVALGLVLVPAWRSRSPGLRREAGGFVMVLLLQTAFDLSNPQVAFAIHASGFALGFAIGLLWPRPG